MSHYPLTHNHQAQGRTPTPAPTPTTRLYHGISAVELRARSARKFLLSLSRLRGKQDELVLLSLHGCLEDALRAHLLLYGHPAAQGGWSALVEALIHETTNPLSPDEARAVNRLNHLRVRITDGDTVTLTRDTILAHHAFVASLLPRYGVLVAVPEPASNAAPPASLAPPTSIPSQNGTRERAAPEPDLPSADYRNHHRRRSPYRALLLSVLVLGLLGVVLVALPPPASTEPGAREPRAALLPAAPPSPTRSLPNPAALTHQVGGFPLSDAAAPLTATLIPDQAATFIPGQHAYVNREVVEKVALRVEPGTAITIPVRLYLSANTAVTVVDGPVQADGDRWWKVRVANQEGWCPERVLTLRQR